MARHIHSGYYEDTYCKHECRDCKRSFIVGETLSENWELICPYCHSSDIVMVAQTVDELVEDMDMGCLGIYFSRYGDGALMLYTEREFAEGMRRFLANGGGYAVPLRTVHEVITDYCAKRDGREVRHE
jgi:DNA-directed RNA polymerase subunit RPC12/RpoP